MKKIIQSLLIINAAFFLGPAVVRADDDITDRFSIALGAFIVDRDTETRLDSDSLGEGSDLDLETDLGLVRSDSVFRIDGYYRFNRRHRLDFTYFDLSRKNSKAIDEELQFGDQIFVVDTTLKATFDLDIYKLSYTYSVLDRESGFLGLAAGIYVADSSIGLAATGVSQVEQGELTAPLPVIGLRGGYRLSDRWTLRANAEYFGYKYENIDGALIDLYAGIDYQFMRHFAMGLGYNSVEIDVDAQKNRFNGSLEWKYAGALLYIKLDY